MSTWPQNPTLYEINTCVWLSELSLKTNTSVDLSSVPASRMGCHRSVSVLMPSG